MPTSKYLNTTVLAQAINYVISNATQIAVLAAQGSGTNGLPATYAQATTTWDGGANNNCLLTTLESCGSLVGAGASDGAGGWQLTFPAVSAIPVTIGGAGATTAQYVAILSGAAILLVTTCTPQTLTNGNTVSVPSFIWDIVAPT